ncbi:MAG: hypothetical protein LQ340_004856, partial [Diploschistes diacapsis]
MAPTEAEYKQKKNDELAALLKGRNLVHTGKKADLVKRLLDSDAVEEGRQGAAQESSRPASAEPSTPTDIATTADAATTNPVPRPEDASNPSSAAALAAGGKGQPPNPQAVPNQAIATDPSQTSDLNVVSPPDPASDTAAAQEAPASTLADASGAAEADADADAYEKKGAEEPAPAPVSFASNLPLSNPDAELEKRRKRAERFGTAGTSAVADDAAKALERQKRFGNGAGAAAGAGGAEGEKSGVKGLDQALPERGLKKRGRGK